MPILFAYHIGNLPDAIEADDYEYDICPMCGDLKLPRSAFCHECAARKAAEEREAEQAERELDEKLRRHRLIKAGLMPNPALHETVAPIVHRYWEATSPEQNRTEP